MLTRPSPPIIGLTSRQDRSLPGSPLILRTSYLEAIRRAGGVPWILPVLDEQFFPEWLEGLDALLLTGGEDVNPLFYGEQPHPKLGRVDTVRDRFELALARQWLAVGKPMLGICRGLQLLQVAAGGTLCQDIRSADANSLRHDQKGFRKDPAHRVELEADSTLARLVGASGLMEVNSIHHQAVLEPAPGFRVCARATDGVAEAIEADDGRLVLGVQWHPEEMESPLQHLLFESFLREVPCGTAAPHPLALQGVG